MPETKEIKKVEPQKARELPSNLQDAQKEFERLKQEIAPFVKKREFTEYTTEGEWCEASSLSD